MVAIDTPYSLFIFIRSDLLYYDTLTLINVTVCRYLANLKRVYQVSLKE